MQTRYGNLVTLVNKFNHINYELCRAMKETKHVHPGMSRAELFFLIERLHNACNHQAVYRKHIIDQYKLKRKLGKD